MSLSVLARRNARVVDMKFAGYPAARLTMPLLKRTVLTGTLLMGAAFAQTTPAPTPAPTPVQTPAQPAAPAAAPATPAADPSTLVATIGTEKVTLGEFDQAFRIAVARLVNSQGVPFEASYLTEFADARRDFLTQYVRDRAVYQIARAANKPDAVAIDAQIAKARENFATDAEFSEGLAQTGFTTPAELRAELERQAVVAAYLDSVKKRLTFGSAVVAGFYNLNKASFTREAEACAKHILVKTQPEAQQVQKDLVAGGDFAAIAKAKSQDPGSAADGGDLGCFGPGQMVAAFDTASFKGPLNTPQLVQTEFGWHVLLVTARTDAGLAPLSVAEPLIREQLARDASQKYVNSQVARLKVESFADVVGAAPTK